MQDDELWRLGIDDLGELFSSGQAQPTEVLASILGRISAVGPRLNAFATLDADGATAAARASDERWQRRQQRGPLDGVPLSIKDNIPVAGLHCCWGSKLFRDFRPERDELPVSRLRMAGAVLLGKTNVSEFTVGPGGTVHTEAFGTTRNPWDLRLTTGSSSGGAVAAVATGMGVAALATDGGGSIRRPASYCSLVGLKPSTGRVARRDGLPTILHDCEVIGPIARSVSDLAILLRAIATPDSQDRTSLAFVDRLLPERFEGIQPQRILYVPRFGDSPVDDAIAESCAQAADNLRSLGHSVDGGTVPFDPSLFDRHWPLVSEAGLAWALQDMDWHERISPQHAEMVRRGRTHGAVAYVDALSDFRRLQAELGVFFDTHDLLMTPTAGAMPWPAEHFGPIHHRTFTGFANVAGVPAITIPCDPSPDGHPIGFQLVAQYGADWRLVEMARQYEAHYPWAHRWPDL
jgi:aspartyl-tRNA(Asn)/glutamyl-tRNA(Gln) amidotransferase subunit A